MSSHPSSHAPLWSRPGLAAGLAALAGLIACPPGSAIGSRVVTMGAVALSVLVAGWVVHTARTAAIRRMAAWLTLALLSTYSGLFRPAPVSDPVLDEADARDEPVDVMARVREPVHLRTTSPGWLDRGGAPDPTVLLDIGRVRLTDGRWTVVDVRARLTAAEDLRRVRSGDTVFLQARLHALRPPDFPGAQDGRPALWRRGITYVGSVRERTLAVVRWGEGAGSWAEGFRHRFERWCTDRLGGDANRGGLVAALAVGERGTTDPELDSAFNASGLAHVLSISGLHLAVAILALAWLLRRVAGVLPRVGDRIDPAVLASAAALPATWGYVLLVGAPAPAVRAALGLSLHFLATLLRRRMDGTEVLGWSLALVAWSDPAALFEPSALLSYLGVAGLLFLTPRVRSLVPLSTPDQGAPLWRRGAEAVLQLVCASVAATLVSTPVTALYFERASTVGALSNVLSWPAATVIVPAGALAAVFFAAGVESVAMGCLSVAGVCAAWLETCARVCAALPGAMLAVPPPSPSILLGTYAGIVGWAAAGPLRRVAWTVAVSALLMAMGGWMWTVVRRGDSTLTVTFLPVGQGDGAVVRWPDGSVFVIDAGGVVSGRFDPGVRVLVPYLRSQGIRRIDVVAASHPHPDHVGGMPALWDAFPVGEFWHNGDGIDKERRSDDPAGVAPLRRLTELAHSRGTRVVDFRTAIPESCPGRQPLGSTLPAIDALHMGDPRCAPPFPRLSWGGGEVEVLHPLNGPHRAAFPELGENDNSLVLRLRYGDVRFLFPGDVEEEGEAWMLTRARAADTSVDGAGRGVDGMADHTSPVVDMLTADVVKAPHHGSRTSSTDAFVRAVGAHHVVFCVGHQNMFHFPNPMVVDRYRDAGCRIHRTDRDGAIRFVTDGRRIRVEHPR